MDLARSALFRPIQLQRFGVAFMLSMEKRERVLLMLIRQTNEKTIKFLIRARLQITTECFVRSELYILVRATTPISNSVTP